MGSPGMFLPTGGTDPVAVLDKQQGQLAADTSFAGTGVGPGSTEQSIATAGVNNTAQQQAFQDFLNNNLINAQTASNKFGGSNGTASIGTGGFPTGFG